MQGNKHANTFVPDAQAGRLTGRMVPSPGVSLRKTQRAPRSCIACSSRKVRCDKSVPCSTCTRRGEAEACVREMVVVRGEVTMYNEAPNVATYEELRHENERLKREVERLRRSPNQSSKQKPHARTLSHMRTPDHDEDGLEDKLWGSLAAAATADRGPSISSWNGVVSPSRRVSEYLIAYDKTWNSWVHYALEYPKFQQECDDFIDGLEKGHPLDQSDPSWLAVYFAVLSTSLLMMDNEEAKNLLDPEELKHQDITFLWYKTAIFGLHSANFMQSANIRTVQATAILGMCFNNWGDSELGQHMWSCALRIAQRIGLNTPHSSAAADCLSDEGQHRLWWTLIICEWLSFPHHPHAIDAIDFDVPLPSIDSTISDTEGPHPAHYHIFMARTATVLHNFHTSMRFNLTRLDNIVEAVKAADEGLAEIIDTLPFHLQPESNGSEEIRLLESQQPWIKWQRFDLTVVLLHLRARINRTLQTQWLSSPGKFEWARSVTISSAMSVIWINHNWDQPASMRKQWALSYHIFASVVSLLPETRSAKEEDAQKYEQAIRTALDLLEEVKPYNAVAFHALDILRSAMLQ